ncbi:isopenicillin N synthase family dioxygenase [Estrella lausannensis]|uniref:2-oxoglutarate-dependent ethylene/succinate-forming enzyme n=1 Tax=Estrella lausannensis TaxID=483423 RepID=A0A0H5DTG2_9BACT|nr:2OG-Fe(II) oxygenase family protein [Estrella lausannensis]CRX39129.1 Putative oxidoreductase [Estrella lausannensis]
MALMLTLWNFPSETSESPAFDATIPVVDMNDYFKEETRDRFISKVAEALHTVGFFAVVNPGIAVEDLERGYAASMDFFLHPLEQKLECYKASINGQRGYVPSETAQGNSVKDCKEFYHIGRKSNIWPTWMNFQEPMENLIKALDIHSEILQIAFAKALGENERFLIDMTETGECLIRALHYPPNPNPSVPWAAQHTDIDLFTILPMATEEGLQVFHEGQWIDVRVPKDAFIVNGGDKLQNLSNGYFKSSLHRVVAKPGLERFSIVYFVHPRDNDPMDPLPQAVSMTGGVKRYPEATSLELLACRLRELGLASPALLQFEKESGIMERIQALVDSGDAADPVKLTYEVWQKSQNTEEAN